MNNKDIIIEPKISGTISLDVKKEAVPMAIPPTTQFQFYYNKTKELYDNAEELSETLSDIQSDVDSKYNEIIESTNTVIEKTEDVVGLTNQVETNKNDISQLILNKQDKLTAGENITINNNVISATSDVTKAYVDEAKSELSDEIVLTQLELAEQKKINEKQEKVINALWKLNKGITYEYQTDSNEGNKIVPNGAKLFDLQSVGGKSIVVNQLYDTSTTVTAFGYKSEHLSDGKVRVTNVSASIGDTTNLGVIKTFKFILGHKYIFLADVPNFAKQSFTLNTMGGATITCNSIGEATRESSDYPRLRLSKAISVDDFPIGAYFDTYVKIVDLTVWYGAGNEPSTYGEFVATYPNIKDMPFTPSTLISQTVDNVVVRGKNLLDFENPTQIIPAPSTTPLHSAGTVYDENIYFEENGKYYEKHIQRVGVVDLGSLNWTYDNSYFTFRSVTINNAFRHPSNVKSNLLCSLYEPVNRMYADSIEGSIVLNSIAHAPNSLWIKDNRYTTPAEFKQAMNGVLLYYELAEPIETITEIDNRFSAIECESNGTISFESNSEYNIPIPNTEEYLIALNEVVQ